MLLTPQLLIQAYLSGSFPMADPDEGNAIYWHTPERRGVIPLDDRFKVSKNLRRLYNKRKFELVINKNFVEVIEDWARSLETPKQEEIDSWKKTTNDLIGGQLSLIENSKSFVKMIKE